MTRFLVKVAIIMALAACACAWVKPRSSEDDICATSSGGTNNAVSSATKTVSSVAAASSVDTPAVSSVAVSSETELEKCAEENPTAISDCQDQLYSCFYQNTYTTSDERRRHPAPMRRKRSTVETEGLQYNCGCNTEKGSSERRRRRSSESAADYNVGTDCTCLCQCFNQYFDCYYDACPSVTNAVYSVPEDLVPDYSEEDCTTTTTSTSTSNSSSLSCWMQAYGDPHMVKYSYTSGRTDSWTCPNQLKYHPLYKSSTLTVKGEATYPNENSNIAYMRWVAIYIGGRWYNVSAATWNASFIPTSPPSKYLFTTCNETVAKPANGGSSFEYTSSKCIAMYSPTGERVTIFYIGTDTSTGKYLNVNVYGYCSGAGFMQNVSCPDGKKRSAVKELGYHPHSRDTTGTACDGLTGIYLAACNYDLENSGSSDTTASRLASQNNDRIQSFFKAVKTVAANSKVAAAAAAGLTGGAVAGIAVATAVAGAAIGAGGVAGAVYVMEHRDTSDAPAEQSREVEVPERKKKSAPKGAGPNVMDPSATHSSITGRAAPVEA